MLQWQKREQINSLTPHSVPLGKPTRDLPRKHHPTYEYTYLYSRLVTVHTIHASLVVPQDLEYLSHVMTCAVDEDLAAAGGEAAELRRALLARGLAPGASRAAPL